MRARFTSLAKRGLLAAGHYSRRLRTDSLPGVAVLCYHGLYSDDAPPANLTFAGLHLRVDLFEAHCRLLRETCHPIALDDWRASLATGRPLPPRSVLVTFDDGYGSVFTLGREILVRYGIPAVLFVCADSIAEHRPLWYDRLARTRGPAEVERVKRLPYSAWLAIDRDTVPPALDDDPMAPLSIDELRELARMPSIEIGSHTARHPILARADRDQQRAEIARDRERMVAWCGQAPRAFAYPNGQPGADYTDETVALVREAGFDFGFTARDGFAHHDEPALERSRFLLVGQVGAAELAHRLAYSWRA